MCVGVRVCGNAHDWICVRGGILAARGVGWWGHEWTSINQSGGFCSSTGDRSWYLGLDDR